jgi:hypothetical protein
LRLRRSLDTSLKAKRAEHLSLIRAKLEEVENTENIFTGGFSGELNPETIVSQIEMMAQQDRYVLQPKVMEVEKNLRKRYEQELEKLRPEDI